MILNRHDTRELAFQALFMLNSNIEAERSEIYLQLVDEWKNNLDEAVIEEMETTEAEIAIPEYLDQLVSGVLVNQADIDAEIIQHLKKGWSLGRLTKTDLIILRLAIYEMKYEEDVPNNVAINEALQLSKKFSDDKTRGFINAVLDKVAQ
ncbi:transcription antitermination factor NusB [Ligilactobacillus ceti]|uniref:Transcription antitermination protein NusB n=1 Tax=Ligilactobacillus ceti DSM 22408 TaxID=1122146 RepID=A0A0R2KNV9_9LACO|nr:transcription antitermination factor NusB [Ligilactobacillus ceti]KRN88668.1 transcription antitermination protein NusB [Ligilactobacillus ceti DSM 22408]